MVSRKKRHFVRQALFALCFTLIAVSCVKKSDLSTQQPIQGFTFLRTPTNELRVGAEHVAGEIVGDGADESDLIVAKSFSKSEISDDSSAGGAVRASLLNFLGISAEVARAHAMRIELEGLETVSLKSPLATRPRAQTDVVYAGLRATGIFITADTSFISKLAVQSEVRSAFAVDLNPSSSRSTLRQTGEGLYIGYKLLRFGEVRANTVEAEIAPLRINGREYHAAASARGRSLNLVIEFKTAGVSSCLTTMFRDGIEGACKESLEKLFPGFTIHHGTDPSSEYFAAKPHMRSVRLYDKSCEQAYAVKFYDFADDAFLGELSSVYGVDREWEYRLPLRLERETTTVVAASVWSPGIYYRVWQEPLSHSGFLCGGGPVASGTIVVSERIYPFAFSPGGSL